MVKGKMRQNRSLFQPPSRVTLCTCSAVFVVCQNRTRLEPAAGDVRSLSPAFPLFQPLAKPNGSRACVTVPAVNILPRTIYKVRALLPAANPDLSQESSTQIGRNCGTRAREKGRGGGGFRICAIEEKVSCSISAEKRLNCLKQLEVPLESFPPLDGKEVHLKC